MRWWKWLSSRRIHRLKSELDALIEMDTLARDGVTNEGMMNGIVERGQRIAELRIEISKLEGTYELRKTVRRGK